ncbi:hypothetical protein HHK36_019201 [Tetracentron sinense]|uniref:Uncharacterized protein n=1 Tax=Tetracentron sinense TaxID=13715 RepID=A0A834YTH4_TETSI|nr:hypothetical protein HHK36_019201 [Tetracentron sinense]
MAFLLPSSLPFQTKTRSMVTKSFTVSSSLSSPTSVIVNSRDFKKWVSDIQSKSLNFALSGALALGVSLTGCRCGAAKAEIDVELLRASDVSNIRHLERHHEPWEKLLGAGADL